MFNNSFALALSNGEYYKPYVYDGPYYYKTSKYRQPGEKYAILIPFFDKLNENVIDFDQYGNKIVFLTENMTIIIYDITFPVDIVTYVPEIIMIQKIIVKKVIIRPGRGDMNILYIDTYGDVWICDLSFPDKFKLIPKLENVDSLHFINIDEMIVIMNNTAYSYNLLTTDLKIIIQNVLSADYIDKKLITLDINSKTSLFDGEGHEYNIQCESLSRMSMYEKNNIQNMYCVNNGEAFDLLSDDILKFPSIQIKDIYQKSDFIYFSDNQNNLYIYNKNNKTFRQIFDKNGIPLYLLSKKSPMIKSSQIF